MSVEPTFRGYVETTSDALVLFEACKRGILPKVSRRLQEKERNVITSGSIFIFDERESGIRRWTDGMVWSPSRILNNFLVYRELDRKTESEGSSGLSTNGSSRSALARSTDLATSRDSGSARYAHSPGYNQKSPLQVVDRQKERSIVGSLTSDTKFKMNGLIKKTMSVTVEGASHHLISYYTLEDAANNKLASPGLSEELKDLEISPEFLQKTNFRVPLHIEGADLDYDIPNGPTVYPGMGISHLGMHGMGNPYDGLAQSGQNLPAGFSSFGQVYGQEGHFPVVIGSNYPSGVVSPFIASNTTQVIPQRAGHAFAFPQAGYLPLGSAHPGGDTFDSRHQGQHPPDRSPVTFVRRSVQSHQRHRSQHSGSFSSSSTSGHSRKSSLASPTMSMSPTEYRLSFNQAFMGSSAPPFSNTDPNHHSSARDLSSTLTSPYKMTPGFGTVSTAEASPSTTISSLPPGSQAGSPLKGLANDLGVMGIQSSPNNSSSKRVKRESKDDSNWNDDGPSLGRQASHSPSASRHAASATNPDTSGRRLHRKNSSSISHSDNVRTRPSFGSPTASPSHSVSSHPLSGLGVTGIDLPRNNPAYSGPQGSMANHAGHYDPSKEYKTSLSWSDLYGSDHIDADSANV